MALPVDPQDEFSDKKGWEEIISNTIQLFEFLVKQFRHNRRLDQISVEDYCMANHEEVIRRYIDQEERERQIFAQTNPFARLTSPLQVGSVACDIVEAALMAAKPKA